MGKKKKKLLETMGIGFDQSIGSNSELPMELVREILARLPVRSLLRFRVVCMSWNSLISSPDFAYLHLARYHSGDDDNTPIVTFASAANRWALRSSHTFRKLMGLCDEIGFMLPRNYCLCANSVNGLVLLYRNRWKVESTSTEMMLWNPIIGKSHQLPFLQGSGVTLGLGFTESDNDYKVVAFVKYPRASVHLYTLSAGRWRVINNYKETITEASYSTIVLVEGALFWVLMPDDETKAELMVSFDVKLEVFDYIPLPSVDSTLMRYPVAYREWVGLLGFGKENLWSLWVMEKDKEPGTWYKHYTVALPESGISHFICFKKNGQLIYQTIEGEVELCDIETQHVKHLVTGRLYRQFLNGFILTYDLYKESLVLL